MPGANPGFLRELHQNVGNLAAEGRLASFQQDIGVPDCAQGRMCLPQYPENPIAERRMQGLTMGKTGRGGIEKHLHGLLLRQIVQIAADFFLRGFVESFDGRSSLHERAIKKLPTAFMETKSPTFIIMDFIFPRRLIRMMSR